jgi:hypothetical protein
MCSALILSDAIRRSYANPTGPIYTDGYNCDDRNPCTQENIDAGAFYFPSQDPTKYVQCSEWEQCWVMPCPKGLVWDAGVNVCNWAPTKTASQTTPAATVKEGTAGSQTNSATTVAEETTAAASQTNLATTVPEGTTAANDVCASNPCLNNGTCNAIDDGFNCTCSSFFGTLCETDIDGMLILRNDISVSDPNFFNRSWEEYQQGFGSPDSLYWIGLDKLHDLSQHGCGIQLLLMELEEKSS